MNQKGLKPEFIMITQATESDSIHPQKEPYPAIIIKNT